MVESQVLENQVWLQVRNLVSNPIRCQVWNLVVIQIENQIGNQVWNRLFSQGL